MYVGLVSVRWVLLSSNCSSDTLTLRVTRGLRVLVLAESKLGPVQRVATYSAKDCVLVLIPAALAALLNVVRT
jgi:hypothetical protein